MSNVIRYKLLRGVNLQAPFAQGYPFLRIYQEKTPLGFASKALFDTEKIFEIELLDETPKPIDPTGDADFDAALRDHAIKEALARRSQNNHLRALRDSYIARGIIELVEGEATPATPAKPIPAKRAKPKSSARK